MRKNTFFLFPYFLDPENLFLNIPWVNGDKKLATFLRDNSNICDWDLNDFIIQDDEEPDAVYLIITGMVRIVRGQYREENESSETSLQVSLKKLFLMQDLHCRCRFLRGFCCIGKESFPCKCGVWRVCCVGETYDLDSVSGTLVSSHF